MAVRRKIPFSDGVYFITITCIKWLPLFEITNGYDIVYKWFDYLKSQGHFVCGYVIMPNHVHALIAFRNTGKSINTIIGNGKRFMAYDFVRRLTDNTELIKTLQSFVNDTDRSKRQLHEVFEPSFDWKQCDTDHLIDQKLNYIHENPCNSKRMRVESAVDYIHSSARFYLKNEPGEYAVTNYEEIKDIDLTT